MTSETQALEILRRHRALITAEVTFAVETRPAALLYDIIRYHLGLDAPEASGKQVRAALCLLACEAMGGTAAQAAPAAAALELVHAFTLLHDDIADQDHLRRGRPTAWTKWGIGQAITAGDALYALANLALGRLADLGADSETIAKAARELNLATLVVCEGQQLDIAFEGREYIGVEAYLDMIGRKTAALIGASCAVGAIVAGAAEEQQAALAEFGRELGLAFQIQDDILGIWGDPAETGKPVGGDLKRSKRSLPVIYALQQADDFAARLGGAIASEEEAAELAAQMARAGIRAQCECLAQDYLDRGLTALARAHPLPQPDADLKTLAAFFLTRVK
jgi:geranylgeranyl diphosphate synthase, type I